MGTLQGRTKSTLINLNQKINNHEQSVVRIFFNGIAMHPSKGISVRVYDNGLTPTTLKVNIRVGDETNAKEVYFSFLIFNPSTAGFASYGGGFNEMNFADRKVYDLNKIIYGSRYSFHGFMGIQLFGEESL